MLIRSLLINLNQAGLCNDYLENDPELELSWTLNFGMSSWIHDFSPIRLPRQFLNCLNTHPIPEK